MNPLIAIAAQVFPAIISALAGDKGGAIATQIAQAVTDVTGAKTADDAKQKVAADPKVAADLQVKLAQIALDAQKAASQQDIAEDALALDSTKSARTTLQALAALGKPLPDPPAYVSYIVIAGFFVTVLLLFSPLPKMVGTDGAVLQIINICIGALTAAFTTVVQFWLGSSLGSKNKDNALFQSATVSNLSNVIAPTQQGGSPSQQPDSQPVSPQPTSPQPTSPQPTSLLPQPTSPQPAPITGPDRFPDCIPLTLIFEGGNDDDPHDPGGRTSRGIIQREWNAWRQTHAGLPSDVWQAPQDQILAIYRQKYWDAMSCGQLPAGIDYCVFDYGVNSGIDRSARALQQLLGTTVDGEIGPLTIDAAAKAAKADAASLVNKICDQRLAFLKGLKTWGFFGKGWTKRVEGVRKQATAMVGGMPVSPTTTPSTPAADPLWLVKARTHLGFSWASGAVPEQMKSWLNLIKTTSPKIEGLAQYCDNLAAQKDRWAYCGAFVAAMLAEAGLPPVFSGPHDTDRFAWAPAWDVYGTKVDIHNGDEPRPGDIMRFKWPGGGEHVTFYDHPIETDDFYHCCGGNQGNAAHAVSIEAMAMNSIVEVRRPPAAAAVQPAPAPAV
jgi:lysozyme family protein